MTSSDTATPTIQDSTRTAAPSRRALAVLVLLVLAAHGLVLGVMPRDFGTAAEPDARPVRPFVIRRIDPVPPAEVRPVTPAPARPVAAAPKPRVRPPAPSRPPPANEAPPLLPPVDPAAQTSAQAATPQAGAAGAADTAATVAAPPASAPVAAAAAPPEDPVPVSTPVKAMDLPGSVNLGYKVTGGSKGLTYYANAELGWRSTGTSYDARLVVSAFLVGSRTMTSTGLLGPQGLAPTRFSDKSRSEVAAHFEPDKGLITFSANTPSVKWTPGAQDRVSVFMQLSGMLAGDAAAFPAGSTITVYTVGPRDGDTWTFRVDDRETLQLPFGEMQGLKLSRVPRKEFDQKVEIWFAPSLVYLPVRIRITQANGDFVDQQMAEISRP